MAVLKGKTFYPYVLDYKPGFFLSWFLYRLFRRISIDESMVEELKRINKAGTVVYAIKYRGHLDYLLYHFNFRRKRLPYPKIAFDLNMSLLMPLGIVIKIILGYLSSLFRTGRFPSPYKSGFYKNAIKQGTTSLLFLIDPKGFSKHFIHAEKDSLQVLLEAQKEMDKPIYIVPQLLLFKTTPEKDYSSLSSIFFGFKEHPGVIRKIVIFFRHNRRAFIDFGRPLNLKDFLENQPHGRSAQNITEEISLKLTDRIDKQKRVILGPIMKSRQQIKENVLTDKGVTEKIERMAGTSEKKLKQLRKKASEHFDEIAADYNITYIQVFHRILRWFWKKIFEGVDVDMASLAKVREWARNGPLIYIPSHKSHIDYLILNYVLYEYHMHIPRIAAGTNLTFWPMGHIFRKCGAFFIRRSFRGTKIYPEVFSRYIKSLLEEGHPIEFYIEGGRSRNGKLMTPKTGFLSILLQAFYEGFCKDLIFVPTSIIYDRILEEKSYIKEIQGDKKKKENIKQVIGARKLLKKRYGKIYLRFNNPISFKNYLEQTGQGSQNIQRTLAVKLVRSINEVSTVTPLSLIATAILSSHRKGFLFSELIETANILLEFLDRYNNPVSSTLLDSPKAVKDALSVFIDWKLISFLENKAIEDEVFYYVDEDKKMELEYYKNSVVHFFIPHSFVAISLLTSDKEIKNLNAIVSDYSFLKRLFRKEFVFNEEEDIKLEILSIVGYFQDFKLISRDNGGYRVSKSGFDKLPIWAALAKTFIESYWIAFKSISQQENGEVKGRNLLKNMNYLGSRLHKLGVIDHIGALSQFTFQNALDTIRGDMIGVKESSEHQQTDLERLSIFGKRLYGFLHYSGKECV